MYLYLLTFYMPAMSKYVLISMLNQVAGSWGQNECRLSGMTQLRISAVLPLLMFSALSVDCGWNTMYVGCKTTCPPAVKSTPTQHSYSNSIWFCTARGIICQKRLCHCLQESKTVPFSVSKHFCFPSVLFIPPVLHIRLSFLFVSRYTLFAIDRVLQQHT